MDFVTSDNFKGGYMRGKYIIQKGPSRETNLAISTISKYMNGGRVREKNRIRIEKAIEKLGYTPNSAARGLRTSRSYVVGW